MMYRYQYSNQIALDWVIENLPHFLFPDISKKKDRIQKLFSGVLATRDQQPVGLMLATYGQSPTQARIHTFAVHPDHQKQHVGTEMLKTLEDNLKQEGCLLLEGYYRSHWGSVPALTQMLANNGWETPKQDLVIVRGEPHQTLHLFPKEPLPLPDGYSFGQFVDLTAADRAYIKAKKEQENWYADEFDPFVYEDSINPRSSLVVRHEGKVMGWVISHLITKDTNEFTSLFIDNNHRPFRLAHLLVRETITRQHEDEIPYFLITSKADGNPMVRLLLRHIPTHDVFASSAYYSRKKLS